MTENPCNATEKVIELGSDVQDDVYLKLLAVGGEFVFERRVLDGTENLECRRVTAAQAVAWMEQGGFDTSLTRYNFLFSDSDFGDNRRGNTPITLHLNDSQYQRLIARAAAADISPREVLIGGIDSEQCLDADTAP